jgi:hypothetical protein
VITPGAAKARAPVQFRPWPPRSYGILKLKPNRIRLSLNLALSERFVAEYTVPRHERGPGALHEMGETKPPRFILVER